jgi:hypothetical protein
MSIATEEFEAAQLAYEDAHLDPRPGALLPGFYPSMPQGHGLLCGHTRALVVLDSEGCIDVGGIKVTDPQHLRDLAAHLVMLADRHEARRG